MHKFHLASFHLKPKLLPNQYLALLFVNTYCSQRKCGFIVVVASSAAFRRFRFGAIVLLVLLSVG